MSTRRIKNAKDLDTGELIYFKGHAQATFMSDGLNVEETISNLANSQTSSKVELLNSISEKQDALVSGTNIKTINGESILGSGDIVIEGGETLTESDIAAMGFTKNTGTYSKPSGGIPKTDLASAVQTSWGKADTALQAVPSGYATETYVNNAIASAITTTLNTAV